MNLFEQSWMPAWIALDARGDGAAVMARVLDCYAQPQRKYHSRQHLAECIGQLQPVLSLAERPAEVVMALWFHDAVYELKKSNNELQSAGFAATVLQAAEVAPAAIARIKQLIMATAHSALAQQLDEQLLVDVDLAILGAPWPRFEQYQAQVREEYAWVPAWLFRRKRRALLQGFLARGQIYSSDYFQQRLEAPARQNLRQAVLQLGG